MENLVIVLRETAPNYRFVYSCFTTLYQTSPSYEHDKKLIRDNLHSLFNQCSILPKGYLHEGVYYVLLEAGASNSSPGRGFHPFNLSIYHPSIIHLSILPPTLSAHLSIHLAINFWKAWTGWHINSIRLCSYLIIFRKWVD